MRCIVLVLSGLFSALSAVAIACSGPDSVTGSVGSSSSGTGGAAGGGGMAGSGGAGGAPIDVKQQCIEYCTAVGLLCSWNTEGCITIYCEEQLTFAGPECQDEFAAYWVCDNHQAHTAPVSEVCDESASPECGPLYADAHKCQYDIGYFPALSCKSEPAPNGGTGCWCRASYQGRELNALCWMEDTKQFCECTIDGVSAGTCEEAVPKKCDDPILYERCCNQYFMIQF